jgi:hypothetical protein
MSRSAQKSNKDRKRRRPGKFMGEEREWTAQQGRHLAYTEEKEQAYAWGRGGPGKETE